MFHKVVYQHMHGAVGFLISIYCKSTKEYSSKKILKAVKNRQKYTIRYDKRCYLYVQKSLKR